MSNGNRKILGVIGGLGPFASAYFYDLINLHTQANSDQDHLDLVISSRASTPDRTGFIRGENPESPGPVMAEEAKKLQAYGAGVLAITCNTAHYFYNEVAAAVQVPVLNMIALTAQKAAHTGCKKLGLLATSGTVGTGLYQKTCADHGIECMAPDAAGQQALMEIIYDEIKAGRPADVEKFNALTDSLLNAGCQKFILGCTELSLLKKAGHTGAQAIDTMEVLAEAAITACGGTPIGFDWPPCGV
ncbi:amino acid racemase [Ruminococcaceae bacterium OttesenSCG-928-D13]|nr:amino acid racemase [Ruminococcaceae bacterium OttesenSCG-928-D13]